MWAHRGAMLAILGLCWPILGLCWPILGLCCPILGLCWPILGAMLAHLEAYVGPCWPILNHKIRKMGKKGKSTKHRKTREFLAVPTCRRLGRRPLSPTERRETPYGYATARGPWPDLSAYARQPARGPTMLAHLMAMLAYVGLRLIHVEPKDPKNGNSKKNTVKRRIFWWSAAYLGAMLAHLGGYVGLSWGQCGPIVGLCWPILGLCWPILGLCWPILGLCCPILGLCWPILGAMLAHLEAYVGPCWPILNHKIRKMGKKGKSTKHRKTREFLAVPTCRRLGRRPRFRSFPVSWFVVKLAVVSPHVWGWPRLLVGLEMI